MGGSRGVVVVVVGLLVVSVSGFATAPDGIGGPTMTDSSVESAAASDSFADAGAGIDAADRLDGPTDRIRAKVLPGTPAAASRLRDELPVRHDFGDVLTAEVTGERYDALAAAENVSVAPVQRVDLAQDADLAVSFAEPTAGATLAGTADVAVQVDAGEAAVEAVTLTVDGGQARATDRYGWSDYWLADWNTTGVDDGTHDLTAHVETESGETATRTIEVTVDNRDDPPTVTWREPSDGAAVSGTVPLEVGASDPDGSVERVTWQVDGGPGNEASPDGAGTWTATWNASASGEGGHNLTAVAVDEAGNRATATVAVEVEPATDSDGTASDAPSVTWTAPTDGATVAGETSVAVTAAAPNGSLAAVDWRVDGGSRRATTYDAETDTYRADWNASAVGAGTHTLTAAATDESGATTAATIDVSVETDEEGSTGGNETEGGNSTDGNGTDGNDTAAPTVAWAAPTDGERVDGTVPVRLEGPAPDEGGTVAWQVDGGAVREATYDSATGRWTATWNASGATAGSHTLRARASDGDGHTATASIEVEVTAEGTPPTVWWHRPLDGDTLHGDVRIQLDAGDPDGSVETVYWAVAGGERRQAVYNDTSGFWEATWDAEAAGNGTATLRAAAVDGDGRTSAPTRIDVTVTGGNAAPTVDWESPADDVTVEGEVDVRIEAADPDGTVERVAWQVDGGQPRPAERDPGSDAWIATWNASDAGEGTYDLRARALDDEGAATTATVTVVVDASNEAPEVRLRSPDDGETVSGDVEVRLEASDPDGSIERVAWLVDDGDERSLSPDGAGVWTATLDTTTLADGDHEIHGGAIDDDDGRTSRGVEVEVANDDEGGDPSITWAWPADDETVGAGPVRVRLDAAAPGGEVAQVRWQVDRGEPQSAERGDDGYWEATWNASDVAAGEHTLRARVQTEAGETAQASVTVRLDEDARPVRDPVTGNETGAAARPRPAAQLPYGVQQVTNTTSPPTRGGDGIDVAIVDTGVDSDHPALQDALAACVDLVASGSCEDGVGHGTHLAGLTVGDGAEGEGVYGVAPEADLHAYKAVAGSDGGYADDVAAAIHRAAERDVEIVVLGLTTRARGSLVERAMAEHRDEMVFVAAAGNDGPAQGSLAAPAAADSAIAVGAVDREGRVLNSSGRGAAGEVCACPDRLELVAAGDRVVSTWPGGGYRERSGTSVAAPQVAGVAARAWADGSADLDGDGTVTPAEVREYLRSHAVDVTDGEGAREGDDAASGAGVPVVP